MSQNQENETDSDVIEIYLGDEFALSQSYSISSKLSASSTKLIFVIGPTEAGKTTLLTKIFDRFQNGPIGNWSFVGSETIVGYEKMLRTYRSNNDVGKPAVDRTTRTSDPNLLHLNLRYDDGEVVGFFMANLSGEIFSDLIKEEDAIKSMEYFKNADHITVVIDGSKILKKGLRALEIQNAFNFLERLCLSKRLSSDVVISIMLSKVDKLSQITNGDAYVKETIDKIKADIILPIQKIGIKVYAEVTELISEPIEHCRGFDKALSIWAASTSVPLIKKTVVIESNRLIDHYKGETDEE